MTHQTIWSPQPGPQHALIDCPLPLIFFGGARGGGKTDGVLGKWAVKEEDSGTAFNAIGFRRTSVSFEDAVERARQIYEPLGGKLTMAGNRPTFKMPNGGRVSFRYLESIQDAQEWQGRNVTDVWIEEAGQYPSPDPIDRLFGVLRSVAGVPPQMILTANPGGPGQHWLRERFGLHPFPRRPRMLSVKINEAEIAAAVIPSRLTDNLLLLESDPEYADRLKAVGSAELVRAWLEGDWSAIEGAFFDEWSEKRHVVDPFEVPKEWLRFRAFDWGSAAPFSVGWWAVATDPVRVDNGLTIPRGALVRYREWYGASGPNKGLKLTVEEVADSILEKESGEKIDYSVADPSIFKEDGGPSFAERFAVRGIYFKPADNKRVTTVKDGRGPLGGWDMMRARLRGDESPMLYVFSTCRDFIRTVPVLQHDMDRPEDLDTESEDHIADEARYACMSRPWTPTTRPKQKPKSDRWDRAFGNDEVDDWTTV